jgi:hypothetical protein
MVSVKMLTNTLHYLLYFKFLECLEHPMTWGAISAGPYDAARFNLAPGGDPWTAPHIPEGTPRAGAGGRDAEAEGSKTSVENGGRGLNASTFRLAQLEPCLSPENTLHTLNTP